MRYPSNEPTPRQWQVIEVIIQQVAEKGYQPTQLEIAEKMGIAQPTVGGLIKELEKRKIVSETERVRAMDLPFVKFVPVFIADGKTGTPYAYTSLLSQAVGLIDQAGAKAPKGKAARLAEIVKELRELLDS